MKKFIIRQNYLGKIYPYINKDLIERIPRRLRRGSSLMIIIHNLTRELNALCQLNQDRL